MQLTNTAIKPRLQQISAADYLLRALLARGVNTVFGYPGGQVIPIYDAMLNYENQLHHVLVRHEQGAAHAAAGYARMTGKAGVCIATSGPGATNLVTGIANAKADSIPLVCITGQVSRNLLGSEAFQEVDIVSIVRSITKRAFQVSRAEDLPAIIESAFRIAEEGRPGPVLIDIPRDVQVAHISTEFEDEASLFASSARPAKGLSNAANADDLGIESLASLSFSSEQRELWRAIEQAAEILHKAKRPLVLLGRGVRIAGAESELRALVDKYALPVVSTLHGLSVLPSKHPLNLGMLGMHGHYAANCAVQEADALLVVGARFSDRTTCAVDKFAPKAEIIRVDVQSVKNPRMPRIKLHLQADAKVVLSGINARLAAKNGLAASLAEWRQSLKNWQDYAQARHSELLSQDENAPLQLGEVVRAVSNAADKGTIIISDVGQNQMSVAQHYQFQEGDKYLASGGLGTMGFALPAAIGAQMAAPERATLAIVGDGGVQMSSQEFATIVQEDLPIKIVLLDNEYLGMVRQWLDKTCQGRYSSVSLKNPDFVALAASYGIKAERVTDRAELPLAITRMFEHKGAYLLDVAVQKTENVFPMVAPGGSLSDTSFSFGRLS